MTIVHLARHGETVWHEGNRYAGRTDVALTPRGLEQAAALARWAADAELARVVSSPLRRALETASVAAAAAALAVETDPRFVEVDFGEAEGLTETDMLDRFPDARAAFVDRPATSPLPGGEAGAAAAARSLAALRDLVDDGRSPVLVVAHTTLIRLTLCALMGLPLDEYRRAFPRLDNVSVTTVRLYSSGGRLRGGLLVYNMPPGA